MKINLRKILQRKWSEQKCCTANRLFSEGKWFGFETILRKKMVQVADHAHKNDDLGCRQFSKRMWSGLKTVLKKNMVWAEDRARKKKVVWAEDRVQKEGGLGCRQCSEIKGCRKKKYSKLQTMMRKMVWAADHGQKKKEADCSQKIAL